MQYEFIITASCDCGQENTISMGLQDDDTKPAIKGKCIDCGKIFVEVSCEKRSIDLVDINAQQLATLQLKKIKFSADNATIQALSSAPPNMQNQIVNTEDASA